MDRRIKSGDDKGYCVTAIAVIAGLDPVIYMKAKPPPDGRRFILAVL
jgi:hypothetical protein